MVIENLFNDVKTDDKYLLIKILKYIDSNFDDFFFQTTFYASYSLLQEYHASPFGNEMSYPFCDEMAYLEIYNPNDKINVYKGNLCTELELKGINYSKLDQLLVSIIEILVDANKNNSKDLDILILLGKIYILLNQIKIAIKVFNACTKLQPENADFYKVKALLYNCLGEYKNALHNINIAILKNDQNADLYYIRASICKKHDIKKPFDDINKAIEIRPDSDLFYIFRSRIIANSYESGLYESAADLDVNRAIQLNPNKTRYYELKSNFTLEDHNEVIRLQQRDLEYLVKLTQKNIALEQYDIAIDNLERSLKCYRNLMESKSSIYYNRGKSYFYSARYREAFNDFKKAIAIEKLPLPDDLLQLIKTLIFTQFDYTLPSSRPNINLQKLRKILISLRKKSEPVREIHSLHTIIMSFQDPFSFSTECNILLGLSHYHLNHFEEADKSIIKYSSDFQIGDLSTFSSNYPGFYDLLSFSIAKHPQNAKLYAIRVKENLRSEDYDKALIDINKAIEISPDDPDLLGIRSIINFKCNDFNSSLNDIDKYNLLTNGKDLLRDVYGISPFSLLLLKSDIYFQMGNYEEAEKILSSMHQLDSLDFDFENLSPDLIKHKIIELSFHLEYSVIIKALITSFLTKHEQKFISLLKKYDEFQSKYVFNDKEREYLTDFSTSFRMQRSINNWRIGLSFENMLDKLSISQFLQAIGIIFQIDDICSLRYGKLAKYIDDCLQQEPISFNNTYADFRQYPFYNNSLDDIFKKDGKELFIARIKLSFVTYIFEYCQFMHTLNPKSDIESMKNFHDQLNNDLQQRIGKLIDEKEKKVVALAEEKAVVEANARREKERMIQQYSHTLANTLYPNSIYEVANKLKNHIEFHKDARILTDAYHAETIIRNQGLLLQARNTGSSAQFQQLIRGDRLPENTSEPAIKVADILNNSIERIVGRLLNSEYHKIDKIREQICAQYGKTIDELKVSFEEEVFFNNNKFAITWVNENINKILVNTSPVWQSIRLRKDAYAEALLQGYFQELLFNALKYGDTKSEIWAEVNFSEQELDGRWYLISEWQNPFRSNVSISTGKGLEGIQNDLEMLNETKDKEKTLKWYEENNRFVLSMKFGRDLFIPYKSKYFDNKK